MDATKKLTVKLIKIKLEKKILMTQPKSTKLRPIQHSFKYLSSLCDDQSNIYTRIALLSFHQVSYSPFIECFLLLIEYIQFMFQALLIYPISATNETLFGNKIYNFIIYLIKLFNPGYFIPYKSNFLSIAVLFTLLLFVLFKCVLIFYILFIARKNTVGNAISVDIWKFIFKTQARVLFFIITIFWRRAAN